MILQTCRVCTTVGDHKSSSFPLAKTANCSPLLVLGVRSESFLQKKSTLCMYRAISKMFGDSSCVWSSVCMYGSFLKLIDFKTSRHRFVLRARFGAATDRIVSKARSWKSCWSQVRCLRFVYLPLTTRYIKVSGKLQVNGLEAWKAFQKEMLRSCLKKRPGAKDGNRARCSADNR